MNTNQLNRAYQFMAVVYPNLMFDIGLVRSDEDRNELLTMLSKIMVELGLAPAPEPMCEYGIVEPIHMVKPTELIALGQTFSMPVMWQWMAHCLN